MAIPAIVAANKWGIDCPTILANLGDYICSQTPDRFRAELALLGRDGFLRSDLNAPFRNSEIQTPVNPDGSIASVDLYYLPEDCAASPDPATVDVCTPTVETGYTKVSFALPTFIERAEQVTLSQAEFDRTCEVGFDSFLAQKVMQKINKLLTGLDQALLEGILAGAGGNANMTGTAGEIEVFTAALNSDGLINANFLHGLMRSARFNRITQCSPAYIFGYAHAMHDVENIANFGCCNNAGADQRALSNLVRFARPYTAVHVDAAMTAAGVVNASDTMVTLHPGAAHLVEYHRYQGGKTYRHGQSYATTWTDPVSGEEFDWKFHWDDCTEQYILTIFKRVQVFTMPTDMYCSQLDGVNGIWLTEVARA